jgi:hypothetical protein
MAFLVPKKWKSWKTNHVESANNSISSLDENDFCNIEETVQISKTESRSSLPLDSSNKKQEDRGKYEDCPVCGTSFSGFDGFTIMVHVDECLTTAVAKGKPFRTKQTRNNTPFLKPASLGQQYPKKDVQTPDLIPQLEMPLDTSNSER